MMIKRLACILLLCVFLVAVTTGCAGCGEKRAVELAIIEFDRAGVEFDFVWDEIGAGNFCAARQHIEKYRKYVDSAAAIIQQADSELSELEVVVWGNEFEIADIRYSYIVEVLDLAAMQEQKKALASPTIEDVKTLIERTVLLSEGYAKYIKNLESLSEQQRSLVPDAGETYFNFFEMEVSFLKGVIDMNDASIKEYKTILAEMKEQSTN